MNQTEVRIAVDTGGTFTDLVLYNAHHQTLATHKLLSSNDDPSRSVLQGIAELLQKAQVPDTAPHVLHGSTVATNALLEGKGGKAAFLTTRGFEDTLHIARQNRPDLYALSPSRPAAPIPRERCLGVQERTRYDGSIQTPLTPEAIEAVLERLRALRVESVAVSLLHSYANPAHEAALGEAISRHLPGVHLTLSHKLLPEIREYARGATCAANALVAPKMNAYLQRLEDQLGDEKLRIMASSGGHMTAREVRKEPVHTVLSGPAGGVVGALETARLSQPQVPPRLITFDMGGTSTDVSLCDEKPTLTTRGSLGALPVRVPLIDIHTVGAGGGSIAWIDAGGALRVGPRSCGADPGPACYGKQKEKPIPTVTDAHMVLGRLLPDRFLGGTMRLIPEASQAAIQTLADPLGLSLEETATGILRIADITMARAIKVISVARGHDPRDFALSCFGGAGGLHACRLAESLGMRRVIVPQHPGLLSALGMLFAPGVYNLSESLLLTLHGQSAPDPETDMAITSARARMEHTIKARLASEGFPEESCEIQISADLRYKSQSHEISTPVTHNTTRMLADFAEKHRHLYGYTSPERSVEVVTLRVRGLGHRAKPRLKRLGRSLSAKAPSQTVQTWFRDRFLPTALVQRSDLRAGDTLTGPAILTEYSSTLIIPPTWTLHMDKEGNAHLQHHPEDAK